MNLLRCLVIPGFIFLALPASGQNFKFRKATYNWPAGKPKPIVVEEQFKDADAVILEDSCVLNLAGHGVPSYSYINQSANYFYIDASGHTMQPLIQRHLRIKLLTTAGARRYAQLTLPELLDPAGDLAGVRMSDRDSVRRPKGDFECIRHVAARVLKEDGRIVAAVLDEQIQVEVTNVNGVKEKLYSWVFRVLNAEPGDEVEWNYYYDKGYNMDPASRIFFNGEIPKQKFHLTIRFPQESTFMLTYHNGAQPYDSIMYMKEAPHNTEYYFSARNLEGCTREAGSRPHRQLPYVGFYRHDLDFGMSKPGSAILDRPLPYPWAFKLISWGDFEPDDLKLQLKKFDKTTQVLNEFVKEERAKTPDTSFIADFSSIQHTLAGFSYIDDLWDQVAGKGGLEKLGDYTEKKTLKASSRWRLYKELLLRFNMEYFVAPLHDKRVCEMEMGGYELLNTAKPVFAIVRAGNVFYFYPKSYRFGYETNELPFYYEDVLTALVSQFAPKDERKAHFPEFNTYFVRTPNSTAQDNNRNTFGEVRLVPSTGTAEFRTRVKLSGQFSTLTRGYYEFGSVDTVINPSYYRVLTDMAGAPVKWTVDKTSLEYPFATTVSATFTIDDILHKDSAGQYQVDLEGWFNQVIEEDFTAKNRKLDFYPDFLWQDNHSFRIRCDQKLQLLPGGLRNMEIDNSFASFSVNVREEEGSIYVETRYHVKSEVVAAGSAKDVQAVYDAIRELKEGKIRVKGMQ